MSGPSSAASMSAASSRLPAPASASLYDLLDQAFITHADAIAFEVPTSDGAETVTYAQLRGQVAQMANALQSAGVKPGDRVMAQVDKSIENVVLYLATLGVGAVYNPLNTAYTVAELSYFLGDAEPALVVVNDKTAGALASGALDAAAPRVETLNANGQGSLRALREAASDDFASVPRESDDLAALLYTSGTTGRSKGAMITHDNLAS
ncbi:MAG: AMP-binding protein, partial [Pseudomonadota bacterium]